MTLPTINRRGLLAVGLALPAATRAGLAAAAPATPQPGSGGGSLSELLGRVAPYRREGERPHLLMTYADISRQLEARGLEGLDTGMSDARVHTWGDGVRGLWADDLLAGYAVVPELWAAVGFGPADVAQTMSLGDPPVMVRLYRGRFDAGRIAAVLQVSGYREEATDGGAVWTIGPEGEYDLATPIQRAVISAYNNLAVVGDELVVASPYLDGVAAALAALAGEGRALGDDPRVAALVGAAGADLVSAGLLDGGSLSSTAFLDSLPARDPDELFATPTPEETIAPAWLALFGITAGSMAPLDAGDPVVGANDATAARSDLIVTVLLPNAEEAARAVPIIEGRLADGRSLATQRPYAELFERWAVEAVDGGPIVRLRLSGDRVGRVWLKLIAQRDLGFLATA